ncbi:TatD family hydrolase [Ursidibacter sp. B-7004-1]
MFDGHIHLDQFSDEQITQICTNSNLQGLIAVATNLDSSRRLLSLKQRFSHIYCCAGFHPEQDLPTENEQNRLFDWIAKNHQYLTACGEVGLPYYRKQEQPSLDYQPYIDLLEQFIQLSKRYDLPLNLHIVYDDTDIALSLLSKYQVKKAHFHWFKASDEMLNELLHTPYYVSVTPDILHNPKTQKVVKQFPLSRLMIETDAPWLHQGFEPIEIEKQLRAIIEQIARLTQVTVKDINRQIIRNVQQFYFCK